MNNDIIKNQEHVFLHLKLEGDLAYKWSIDNNDPRNMQLVLRAHNETHAWDFAQKQIKVALEFNS